MARILTVGERLARKLFERRGNHSEAHLSEAEVAELCDGAITLAARELIERVSKLNAEIASLRTRIALLEAPSRIDGGDALRPVLLGPRCVVCKSPRFAASAAGDVCLDCGEVHGS